MNEMAKTIAFTDEQYEQIVEAALESGYAVCRGRGSQLGLFVTAAANTARTGRVVLSPPQALSKPKKLPARKVLSQPATSQ
jgi:hypothetical protein